MIQKITQNNGNFWTVNLMRAKIVSQSSDFLVRRTGSYRHKKALVYVMIMMMMMMMKFLGTSGIEKSELSGSFTFSFILWHLYLCPKTRKIIKSQRIIFVDSPFSCSPECGCSSVYIMSLQKNYPASYLYYTVHSYSNNRSRIGLYDCRASDRHSSSVTGMLYSLYIKTYWNILKYDYRRFFVGPTSALATSDKRGINVNHVCDIVSMLGQCQSARRVSN